MKLQSAGVYFLRYGLAFFIVAAMALIIIFGQSPFSHPKALPNSCVVLRPNGPGTANFANLVGSQCNNNPPDYVLNLSRSGSYISAPSTSLILANESFTISVWEYLSNYTGCNVPIVREAYNAKGIGNMFAAGVGGPAGNEHAYITLWDQQGNPHTFSTYTQLQTLKWYNLVYSYNRYGKSVSVYINGNLSAKMPYLYGVGYASTPLIIGNGPLTQGCTSIFSGYLSNVQIYNNSVAQTLAVSYDKGIGSVPTQLQSLVAWYSLNSYSADYSGNNNNGKEVNASFSSQWIGTYLS
jgi:hypothetical protein